MIQSSTNPLGPSALAQPPAAAVVAGAGWQRWFIPVLVAVVVLDQVSKYWLFNLPKDTRFPSWIELAYNRGVAFGMFGAWPTTVFLFTLALIPALGWLYWTYYRDGRWGHIAFALILGGALGNGWDRLMTKLVGASGGFAGVRDFILIDLHPLGIDRTWPNFNVADSAICVGFAILVALAMAKPVPPPAATVPSPPSSSPDANHPTASGRGDS